jgi:hypothetical protein
MISTILDPADGSKSARKAAVYSVEERFNVRGFRQCYLWRNAQRNKNPGTYRAEIVSASLGTRENGRGEKRVMRKI